MSDYFKWPWQDFSALWVGGGILGVLLVILGISLFFHARKKKKKQPEKIQETKDTNTEKTQTTGSVGKLHHIGSRRNQQDSFGVTSFAGGQFVVVADGMGGLSGGDKISQRIVMTMLQDAAGLKEQPDGQILFRLVSHANQEINRMIGRTDCYTSGSTVVAAIISDESFHWVSVGDSRIYLYRNQRLIQLNREHTYEAELLVQAVNGEVSFEEAQSHPKRNGLTSFIGMGELKYVDGSRRGIRSRKGDRLLLMTDGVFHTLSEEEILQVTEESECAEDVAKTLQERILSRGNEKQDNFTAVIIDL